MGLFKKIAMIVPNSLGIYAPSRIDTESIEIDDETFLEKFADSARAILVSRADDGVSDSAPHTAWGFGLKGWFINDD